MVGHLNKNILTSFYKEAKTLGIWFILLGIIGIFFPMFLSLLTNTLVALLLLFAGVGLAYFTLQTNTKAWLDWIRSLVLILIAMIMLVYPTIGIESLGILLGLYFLVDAFLLSTLTFGLYPTGKWGLWLFNALIALSLGLIFLLAYPFETPYLLGLYIGISFFFNGLTLLISSQVTQRTKDQV